jgi:hypothetical protein
MESALCFPGTLEKFLGKKFVAGAVPREAFRPATALTGEYSKSQKEAATSGDDEPRIAPNELEGLKESSIGLKGGFTGAIRTF